MCGLLRLGGCTAGRFQAGVSEELGDDHEVGAAAHERARERVPQDVDGRAVLETGARGNCGDDVVRAADAEATYRTGCRRLGMRPSEFATLLSLDGSRNVLVYVQR